jgi:hypothetical protein
MLCPLLFVAADGGRVSPFLGLAWGLLIEDGPDRLLAGGMIGRDVQEFSYSLRLEAAQLVDQAPARGP